MSLSPVSIPGARLRARRQELGLTLDEVADRTRIRRTYLEALEDDRRDVFPGEAYRTGFLRIYAGLLELKPERLLEGEECPSPAAPPATPSREPAAPSRPGNSEKRRGGKGIYAVVIALLLVGGAIATAFLFQGPSEAPPPAPAPALTPAPAPAPAPEMAPLVPPSALPEQAPAASEEGLAPETTTAPSEPGQPATETESAPEQSIPLSTSSSSAAAEPGPPPGAAEVPPATQAAVESAPAAVPKTNVLRLQALGTNRLELILDNRPPQRYDLKAETQLSWKVRRSALIRVEDPSTVRLWFGDRPLDFGGKSQILVQSGPEPRKAP